MNISEDGQYARFEARLVKLFL